MKKLSWIIAICGTMTVIVIGCKTRFPTAPASYKAASSSAAVARGRVLAFGICAGCHYNKNAGRFIGMQIADVPAIAGKIYSANLTHSKSAGVMRAYTDADVKYLLRTGVAKDGRYLSYMLRPNLSDGDIDAIIAYFRSEDAAVAADNNMVGKTSLTFIGKAFMNLKADPLPYRATVPLPPAADEVKTGYYLVDNLGCYHCHSKKLTSLNYLYPDQSKGYLAGGIKMKSDNGTGVKASNITPDKNTGIGNYTQEQFYNALAGGHAPDRTLKPPMPRFDMLSRPEIDAIFAYLQTVPAKEHPVTKM